MQLDFLCFYCYNNKKPANTSNICQLLLLHFTDSDYIHNTSDLPVNLWCIILLTLFYLSAKFAIILIVCLFLITPYYSPLFKLKRPPQHVATILNINHLYLFYIAPLRKTSIILAVYVCSSATLLYPFLAICARTSSCSR